MAVVANATKQGRLWLTFGKSDNASLKGHFLARLLVEIGTMCETKDAKFPNKVSKIRIVEPENTARLSERDTFFRFRMTLSARSGPHRLELPNWKSANQTPMSLWSVFAMTSADAFLSANPQDVIKSTIDQCKNSASGSNLQELTFLKWGCLPRTWSQRLAKQQSYLPHVLLSQRLGWTESIKIDTTGCRTLRTGES